LSERPAEARRADARAPVDRRAAGRFAGPRRLEAPADAEARLAFGFAFDVDRLREPPVDFEPPDLVAMKTPHLGGQVRLFHAERPPGEVRAVSLNGFSRTQP
jgi:hypothetical protein